LRQVVFTTAGGGGQVEIWRRYPLAVDGWLCPSCGWSAIPRFIGVEESVEFARLGAEHAASGQFDDAEFWFRRIIGSWPRYAAGYADLGQLLVTRAEAARTAGDRERYRNEALSWFRRSADADPERRIPAMRVPFARLLALDGSEEEALAILDSLLANPTLEESLRTDAAQLGRDIRAGKALFSRAAELVEPFALGPPSKLLDATARKSLEAGRTLLQRAHERTPTFASAWFLGKVEMRLGHLEAALPAFLQAYSLDPNQADGCRELAALYLELDRAGDALPVARRALELRPDDAGLRCNLALVLLLTGDVPGAHAEATTALSRAPDDRITRSLLQAIDEITAGRRARPRSLAEAEGRKR
jgi:tetratricopeptide (TPR) repeat protein